MYSPLGRLIRKGLDALLGKVLDGATSGELLDPDFEFEEDELEPGPVYPNETRKGLVPRSGFQGVFEALDTALDRGFRGAQVDVLGTRAGRLGLGEHFELLCQVYHGGVPTGLQVVVMRIDSDTLGMTVEGRGPAMAVVEQVFRRQKVLAEEERDGVFRERRDESGWRAVLPLQQGGFMGRPVAVEVDHGWPGLEEGGHPEDSEVLQEVLKGLGPVLGVASRAFSRFVDEDVASDIGEVVLTFPATAREQADWTLVVARSSWAQFKWLIQFRGLKAVGITAGS